MRGLRCCSLSVPASRCTRSVASRCACARTGRVQYAHGVATLSSPHDIFLPPEGVRTPIGDEPMVLPDKVVVPLSVLQQGVVLGYDRGRFVALTP